MGRTLVLVFALLLTGACRTTETLGRQVDDSVITSKLNAKLAADPDVNMRDVAVQTDEGMVTLTGRVENVRAKSEAERLARQIDGVRGVRNHLAVGPMPGSSAAD